MKAILLFIRTTLTGGILLLLPVVLAALFISKALDILEKISTPFARVMPDNVLGFDGSKLTVILLLIAVCFIGGLMFRLKMIQRGIDKLEKEVLSFLPGYSMIKSITADALGKKIEHKLLPVLIKDGDHWNLGFLIEKGSSHSTVFVPDAPRHDAGEIRIVQNEVIKELDLSISKFDQSIRNYGVGLVNLVK
jgi:uncharacterized membrane protein